MENDDFSIDSNNKNNLSKGAKIFHYALGLLLITASSIIIYRLLKSNTYDIVLYSNITYLLVGILFISRGLTGRYFPTKRKYILLTNDSLKIKRPLKKEIQVSKDSLEWISIKPSEINLKTNDDVINFDLT